MIEDTQIVAGLGGYLFILLLIIGLAISLDAAVLPEIDGVFRVFLLNAAVVLAIVFADVLTIYLLSLSTAQALLIVAISLTLFYLPVRAALRRTYARLFPHSDPTDAIARLLLLAQHDRGVESYSEEFAEIVAELFSARHVRPATPEEAAGRLDALSILVAPLRAGEAAYVVSGKAAGQRLFTGSDRRLVSKLEGIARRVAELGAGDAAVRARERERIARDLHDLVGNRLLALKLSAAEGPAREAADGAILALRNTMRSLSMPRKSALEDALNQWAQTLRAALPSDAPVPMAVQGLLDGAVDRFTVQTVSAIVQEYATNLLKHGRPETARIRVDAEPGRIVLLFENEMGQSGPTERTRASDRRGIANVRARMAEIEGRCEITMADGRFRMSLTMPTAP
ncbi:MAG: histidine kinase, partial [Pseudomonadota bacterium]